MQNVTNPKEAISMLLKITRWSPTINNSGENEVELDGGVLRFFSPDGACLIFRQDIQSLPDDEFDLNHICKQAAKLNAGLAPMGVDRLVIIDDKLVLESIIKPSDFFNLSIEDHVEEFLNDFDFVVEKLRNATSSMGFSPFMML
jgi:hypothetical protein